MRIFFAPRENQLVINPEGTTFKFYRRLQQVGGLQDVVDTPTDCPQ